MVTALAALSDRFHWGIALTSAHAFGTERFAGLTPIGVGLAAALVVGFFLLNLAGVRALGAANRWVTVWKVVVPIATAARVLGVFRPSNVWGAPGGASRRVGPPWPGR